MAEIGKLTGTAGTSHQVLSPKADSKILIPIPIATETIQASCRAYTEKLAEERENPLEERLKILKKPPFGEEIPGPNQDIPRNRAG